MLRKPDALRCDHAIAICDTIHECHMLCHPCWHVLIQISFWCPASLLKGDAVSSMQCAKCSVLSAVRCKLYATASRQRRSRPRCSRSHTTRLGSGTPNFGHSLDRTHVRSRSSTTEARTARSLIGHLCTSAVHSERFI